MNTQEIKQWVFDTVVKHARKQGEKAVCGNVCRYRTDGGLKCFIGGLIDDDQYSRTLEDYIAVEEPVQQAIIKSNNPIDAVFFQGGGLGWLWNLQDIHDHRLVGRWEEMFTKFAEENNLEFIPV